MPSISILRVFSGWATLRSWLQRARASDPDPQVLVGHSLGAGVCELLAVLLLGGAKAGEVPYTLPEAGRGRLAVSGRFRGRFWGRFSGGEMTIPPALRCDFTLGRKQFPESIKVLRCHFLGCSLVRLQNPAFCRGTFDTIPGLFIEMLGFVRKEALVATWWNHSCRHPHSSPWTRLYPNWGGGGEAKWCS